MSPIQIIGNVIALVASILMVYSGALKRKQSIIMVQTVQIGLSVLSNIILGSISGAIVNALGCVRNILCYKDKYNKIVKVVLAMLTVLLSGMFNSIGIIGWCPIIATTVYVIFMDTKDVIKLKYLIVFAMIMWTIHDFAIKSYTSSLFNLANIIVTSISIYKIHKHGEVA